MAKHSVTPLANAYRLLNPGCVVLVSVGDGTGDNLFAVTWNMPLKKDPPMAAILSGKRHFSYPFIERTGEFGINLMDADYLDALYGCGTVSGRDGEDKWARFGLTRQQPQQIKAPLVAEAVASLECKVEQVVELGPSALIVAQIVAATAEEAHFGENGWSFDQGLRLLHHLSGDKFCTSEKVLRAK